MGKRLKMSFISKELAIQMLLISQIPQKRQSSLIIFSYYLKWLLLKGRLIHQKEYALNIIEIESNSKKDFAYTVIDATGKSVDADTESKLASVENVIRVRVIR